MSDLSDRCIAATSLENPSEVLTTLIMAASRLAKYEKSFAWLDENTTFSDAKDCLDCEGIVLASVSKRIWYHATNDEEAYPFSAVTMAGVDNE